MRPFTTLRSRLIASAAIPIVLALALFAAAAVILARGGLRSSLDDALRRRAEDVAQLAVSAPALLTDPGALEAPTSGRQIALEVLDAHGRIIARSLTLGARLLPRGPLAERALTHGQTGFADIRLGSRPFREYAAPIAQAGGPASGGAVLLAADTGDISDTTHRLSAVLAIAGAAIALAAVLLATLLTGRGLRPLRQLARDAEEIERTGDPRRRLRTGRGPAPEASAQSWVAKRRADELAGLAQVLNRMLGSLESSRAAERRFLADASHELRTPVTTLLGNTEFAVRHGADAELLAELRRDAASLARLVDDLLVLEREASADHQAAPIRLDELVRHTAAGMEGGDRVHLERLDAVTVTGTETSLRLVVRNLIENALVHGPEEATVTVKVERLGAEARLGVSDEGPGPPVEEVERIFERFWRGSGASQRPGSGLGLSIVAAVVSRHRGRVELSGAAFTVILPVVVDASGVPVRRPAPHPSAAGDRRSAR